MHALATSVDMNGVSTMVGKLAADLQLSYTLLFCDAVQVGGTL